MQTHNFSILKTTQSPKDCNRKKNLKKRYRKDTAFQYTCSTATILAALVTLSLVLLLFRESIPPMYSTEILVKTKPSVDLLQEKVYSIDVLNKNKRNSWVKASAEFDYYYRHGHRYNHDLNEIIVQLEEGKQIRTSFNYSFFKNRDSIYPELAGIATSLKGTFYSSIIFLIFLSIFGIAGGIYLSEFIQNKTLKHILELNINNLKAIPSAIYGLIGLAIVVNTMHAPRSSSLAAGLTLGIMLLPIIITITKHHFLMIPSIMRDNAYALGATKTQVVFKVLLKIAAPKIITGMLIAFLRGIGETACLIIIGMVAYIQTIPTHITDPATTVPVQIFLWIKNPGNVFVEKAAALSAILVLFVILANIAIATIRNKANNYK